MPDRSLRAARDELIADRDLTGTAFCRSLSDATDACMSELASAASDGNPKKIALVAVGGYGRQELCPYSDLDLVLIHDGRRDIKEVADALWYPVWDQGIKVDHAVRRPKDMLRAASQDLRVALGLLDARLIWGDPKVADPLIEKVRTMWRASLAQDFLPALERQMAERHQVEGDVAFLLEPNLKEAHGGLRDISVLRALGSCAPRLTELVDLDIVSPAANTLMAVRVELHRDTNRALDRMLLQEQDSVAAALEYLDADDLCRAVSEAGRSIARLSDETWRRRRLWAPGEREALDPSHARIDVEPGIAISGGEVTLTPAAPVSTDTSLVWRLAAVGAEHDLPLSLGAVHRLAELTPTPPNPWPDEVRESLVRLLRSGHSAIAPFESLDHQGLVARMLPEWEHVRHHHQRNAYHRFTVDRHLLEAAANAADLSEGSDRPDLLLIGALVHDIGKGLPGDHTELGIEIVGEMAPRMGFSAADTSVLQSMVAHHLLLADTATRRDLSDPKTIETVASAVTDRTTLQLLGTLTKADSLATGSSAWGSWKEQLVSELVARTDQHLAGTRLDVSNEPEPTDSRTLIESVRTAMEPVVLVEPPMITVAALDRPGLLADVAGTLALHGLDVHAADAESIEGVAVDRFTVDPSIGGWPEPAELLRELLGVFAGEIDLDLRLAQRRASYAPGRQTWSAHPTRPSVSVDHDASAICSIIEVRAIDDIGLLHALTSALFEHELDVIAARVATIGGEVVDAFYVRSPEGTKLRPGATLEAVVASLSDLITSP